MVNEGTTGHSGVTLWDSSVRNWAKQENPRSRIQFQKTSSNTTALKGSFSQKKVGIQRNWHEKTSRLNFRQERCDTGACLWGRNKHISIFAVQVFCSGEWNPCLLAGGNLCFIEMYCSHLNMVAWVSSFLIASMLKWLKPCDFIQLQYWRWPHGPYDNLGCLVLHFGDPIEVGLGCQTHAVMPYSSTGLILPVNSLLKAAVSAPHVVPYNFFIRARRTLALASAISVCCFHVSRTTEPDSRRKIYGFLDFTTQVSDDVVYEDEE